MVGRSHVYNGSRISPLQFVILLILLERPMYGYEMVKRLRDEFVGVWTPQTGSVYPALKKLGGHGLVFSDVREDTEYYSISKEGVEFVTEGLKEMPGDIQFMMRYFQILDGIASRLRDSCEGSDRPFLLFFDGERIGRQERLAMLRRAREVHSSRLSEIDSEMQEIWSEMEDERRE